MRFKPREDCEIRHRITWFTALYVQESAPEPNHFLTLPDKSIFDRIFCLDTLQMFFTYKESIKISQILRRQSVKCADKSHTNHHRNAHALCGDVIELDR